MAPRRGLLVVILLGFVAFELLGLIPVSDTEPFFYLFSALVTGNLTLITVVVAIVQLVLSRELGSVTDLQKRIAGASEYRQEIETELDAETSPILPTNFLAFLFQGTRREAQTLREDVSNSEDAEMRADLTDFVETFTARLRALETNLSEQDVRLIDALSESIAIDYSTQVQELSRLCVEYEDALSAEAEETVERLMTQLRQIDIAQQYFKTIYVQEDLAYLSKTLLYIGLPMEVLASIGLLAVAVVIPPTGGFEFPPYAPETFLTVFATVQFAPLVLIFVFMVRVGTISRRTTPTSPFTIPQVRSSPPDE